MTQESAVEDKIRASFARQSMMSTLQADLLSIGNGRVVISAPIGPAVLQQQGFAHAALAFALGDSAAGYSALSVMAPEVEVLTAEMKINLIAPAEGDRLEAVGHVIRAGRRLVVVGATVTACDGSARRDVAVLQGTMVPVTAEP
jgi:uncharacterized protein (TIGR00369 family)